MMKGRKVPFEIDDSLKEHWDPLSPVASRQIGRCCREGNLNMPKYWRPLTQDELPYLASGDTLTIRLTYLYNPERLPVTYVAALCVERRKRDGTFLVEGTDFPISISLTEAGRYAHDGWQMTGEELSKLK